MNRLGFASCAVSLGLLGGCTYPSTGATRAPDPPRPAAAAREPPTLGLAYELTRQGDGAATGIVISGHSDLGPHNVMEVEQHATRTGEKEELRLKMRPRDDGSVLVEVRYAEVSADGGRHIAWEPLVHVARGVPAVAEIQGPGWSRAIRVRIE